MLFYGCVYANPKASLSECERTKHGAPVDLTRVHLQRIEPLMRGLPVRVEHGQANIGEVVSAQLDEDGAMYVAFRFHNTLGGIAAKEYVLGGATPELSLRHDYYTASDEIAPIEVSIVQRGARPDTKIIRDPHVIYRKNLHALLEKESRSFREEIMASEQTMTDAAGKPEPAPKKQRLMNAEFATSIADKLSPDEAKELYMRFNASNEGIIDMNKKMRDLQTQLEAEMSRKQELEERLAKEEKTNEQTSEEIVSFLNKMRECTQQAPIRDTLRDQFASELRNSPLLRAELGATVPVACSQLTRTMHLENDLGNYRNKLLETERMVQEQLGIPAVSTKLQESVPQSQAVAASKTRRDAGVASFLSEEMAKGYEQGSVKANDVFVVSGSDRAV